MSISRHVLRVSGFRWSTPIEEGLLLFHDLRYHLDHGPAALLDGLHDPARRFELGLDEILGLVVPRTGRRTRS
jgi:hypothetical protein